MAIFLKGYLQACLINLTGRLKSAKYEAFKLKPNGGVLDVRWNEV